MLPRLIIIRHLVGSDKSALDAGRGRKAEPANHLEAGPP